MSPDGARGAALRTRTARGRNQLTADEGAWGPPKPGSWTLVTQRPLSVLLQSGTSDSALVRTP